MYSNFIPHRVQIVPSVITYVCTNQTNLNTSERTFIQRDTNDYVPPTSTHTQTRLQPDKYKNNLQ